VGRPSKVGDEELVDDELVILGQRHVVVLPHVLGPNPLSSAHPHDGVFVVIVRHLQGVGVEHIERLAFGEVAQRFDSEFVEMIAVREIDLRAPPSVVPARHGEWLPAAEIADQLDDFVVRSKQREIDWPLAFIHDRSSWLDAISLLRPKSVRKDPFSALRWSNSVEPRT
jgi:hypothetical protein